MESHLRLRTLQTQVMHMFSETDIAHCILDLDTNKHPILQKINYSFGISEIRDNIFHLKIQRLDTSGHILKPKECI